METTVKLREIGKFKNIHDLMKANEAIGNFYFSEATMAFFNGKVESGVIAGRFFMTSERKDSDPRRYTVRVAMEDGSIETVGRFQQFTRAQAAKALEEAKRVNDVTQFIEGITPQNCDYSRNDKDCDHWADVKIGAVFSCSDHFFDMAKLVDVS